MNSASFLTLLWSAGAGRVSEEGVRCGGEVLQLRGQNEFLLVDALSEGLEVLVGLPSRLALLLAAELDDGAELSGLIISI
jgi:hypothetical protein